VSPLFGTDGVRGVANAELTPELAFRIGRAGASVLSPRDERHALVVVGRDTRLSGTMLEAAIVAGLTSVGCDVVSLGIVPTPAVACITRHEGAAAGIMISASHNPIADNGIKFFGADGFKLSDEIESAIESAIDSPDLPRPTGAAVGIARVAANLGRHYYAELYQAGGDLRGLHVVVDGAFGSAFTIAPYALRKLGAKVSELHCTSDGARINVRCGATDLRSLQAAVRERIAAGERHVIGVAFDGDADRALFVDETGSVVTGDHVMFAIGTHLHARGELPGNAIVATVMSNIGLERALRAHEIGLIRAPVGDRYVIERMRGDGYVFGGEQSGHIIDLRRNTTGDGPMTMMTLLQLVAASQTTLRELTKAVIVAPQVLFNIATPHAEVLGVPSVLDAISAAERTLDGAGRLLVRASGTEPLIRVMAEGDNSLLVERAIADVVAAIEKEIAVRA
jgi:phosphoglucosamine mutase